MKDPRCKIYYNKSDFITDSNSSTKNKNYHIFILHDFYDYHEMYTSLSNFIGENISFVASLYLLDLPGFGLSSGRRGNCRSFSDFCSALNDFIHEQVNDSSDRVIIIGQGLGGLLALYFYQESFHKRNYKLEGLICSNPLISFNLSLPIWGNGLITKNNYLSDQIKMPWKLDFNTISTDSKKILNFMQDSLCSDYVTLGLYREIIATGKLVRENAYFIDIPILFLVSQSQIYVKFQDLLLFHKSLLDSNSSINVYEDMKQNLFNERNHTMIYSDLRLWLNGISKKFA